MIRNRLGMKKLEPTRTQILTSLDEAGVVDNMLVKHHIVSCRAFGLEVERQSFNPKICCSMLGHVITSAIWQVTICRLSIIHTAV